MYLAQSASSGVGRPKVWGRMRNAPPPLMVRAVPLSGVDLLFWLRLSLAFHQSGLRAGYVTARSRASWPSHRHMEGRTHWSAGCTALEVCARWCHLHSSSSNRAPTELTLFSRCAPMESHRAQY
jgi:hypothetical protein